MKDHKVARNRFWGQSYYNNNAHLHPSRGLNKGKCKVTGLIALALFTLVVFFISGRFRGLPASPTNDVKIAMLTQKVSVSTATNSGAAIQSHRNTSFTFLPKIAKWDVQRGAWMKKNSHLWQGRSKVLLVTGSQTAPCERSVDSHMFLKAAKNKIHYVRLHDLQMHYSLLEPNPEFTGSWAKLPVLRMLMVAHPEVEWFWWMDSDTVITDLEFELPLKKYDAHNFVISGDEHSVHDARAWNGLLTANFLIRNCEWSLRLLDAWGSMGPSGDREDVGKFLSDFLQGRPDGADVDDQSALVYLLSTEKSLWAPKLFLEKDFDFTGAWTEVTSKLEVLKEYPLVTHFAGCSQCGGRVSEWPWELCQKQMQRALDFADNQVYKTYGFKLRELGIPELVPIPNHKLQPVVASQEVPPLGQFLGYPVHKLPGPTVTNWDQQREEWFKNNPAAKRTTATGQPKTMIVTGSSYSECLQPVGSQFLLHGLKNKVDYARFHDIELFYDGMVHFDKEMTGWWTKIPTIRLLMLTRPDVEWFWWCDADAVITDMVLEFPFKQFSDKNLILYGNSELVEKHDWIAVNAGIYLVRNCQWTLDFFDIWAALGVRDVLEDAGKMSSEMLPGRDVTPSDDQSALIIMLMTDKEKRWYPKVALERKLVLSGFWKLITPKLEQMHQNSHPGLGTMDWPLITHFAGCQPCGKFVAHFDFTDCQLQMQRTFDFADNQVLELYGLQHFPLGTYELKNLRASN